MKPPLRVLVIDDSPADFRLVRRALARDGLVAECERVDNYQDLARRIGERWDIALLDYLVPGMDCADSLARLRRMLPDTPVILISGAIGEERTIELLRHGAWDLVLKDHLGRLADTVRRCLEVSAEAHARRQVEDRHSRYRKQLHAFVHYAPLPLALLDRQMNYLAVSRSWTAEFGHGQQDLVGCNHYEVLRHVPAAWRHAYRAAQEGALFRKDEDCWVQADGSERWLRWAAHPWSDEDGEIGGIIISAEDITERKLVERTLGERDRAYRAAIETAADGFWAVDMQGRLIEVNEAYVRRSGYSRDELLSKHIADLDAVESSSVVAAKIRKIRKAGSALFETRHRARDGSEWPAEVRVSFSDIAGGRFLVFIHDISARKRIEREAWERRTELEMLLQQQVAAQTAAAIAHELNQPLVSVSFYGEAALGMLKSGGAADKLRRTLEATVAQAQRAGKTLHELLDFLRKGDTAVAPMDLNAAVAEALAIARNDGFGGFQPDVDLEPGLPAVVGNPLQVQKVLLNLFVNSVEAMRGAGVAANSITVTVRTAAGRSMAQVTVRDSGPGLDADTRRRIFEPFFTTKPRGIGLGLAISRSLVEAHGGQLWADEDEGPGATFHFTLPFAAAP